MGCCKGSNTYAELVMEVKQGEARNFGFTIEVNDEPMDLTGYTVLFLVKQAPYESLPSIISKTITTELDEEQGQIYSPTEGKFLVTLTENDTKLPPYDYSLVIELTDGTQTINISGDGNTRSVFRVCCQ